MSQQYSSRCSISSILHCFFFFYITRNSVEDLNFGNTKTDSGMIYIDVFWFVSGITLLAAYKMFSWRVVLLLPHQNYEGLRDECLPFMFSRKIHQDSTVVQQSECLHQLGKFSEAYRIAAQALIHCGTHQQYVHGEWHVLLCAQVLMDLLAYSRSWYG